MATGTPSMVPRTRLPEWPWTVDWGKWGIVRVGDADCLLDLGCEVAEAGAEDDADGWSDVRSGVDVVDGGLGVAEEVGHQWSCGLSFRWGVPPLPAAKIARISHLRGGFVCKILIPDGLLPKSCKQKVCASFCCLQKRKPGDRRGFFSIFLKDSRLDITNVPRGCCCLVRGSVVAGLDMRKC